MSISEVEPTQERILKRIDSWGCMKNCGACCKLGPIESRPDLGEYLDSDELIEYKSMIGKDNWCVNFDQENRLCKIYNDRPNFCRVDQQQFKKMYDIDNEDFVDFCTFCCREQITDVFGEDSKEFSNYEDLLIDLSIEEGNIDLEVNDEDGHEAIAE